jgi:hypothetical protein
MPSWTSPPTFVADSVLSAAQLNIISDDLEYLYGYVSGQNPCMASLVLTVDGDAFGVVRHLQRYLHVVYLCQDDIKIYYDATEVFHDGAPDGTINDSAIIDLNSFGFTVGQLYTVRFLMDSGTVFYAYESDSAS